MNHRFNAKLKPMDECPECGAVPGDPCVSFFGSGIVVAPHRVREQLYRGELIVARTADVIGKKGREKLVALADQAEDRIARRVGVVYVSPADKRRNARERLAEKKRRAG